MYSARPAAFSTRLMRGLLGLALAALGFSSTTVAALGLDDLRIVVFALVFVALCAGAVVSWPRFGGGERTVPLLALWLLALIALVSHIAGPATGGLLDYKILLPILALLLAPNLRAAMGELDLARFALRAGSIYILATAAVGTFLPAAAVLRNVSSHVRVDVTGSIVLHASLCTILVLGLLAAATTADGVLRRLWPVLLASVAAWMVMLTGTRSAALSLLFFLVLWTLAGGAGQLVRPRLLALGLLALGCLVLLSLVASDAIWARLTATGEVHYSSGRWPAIRHWLSLAAGQPFGLGIGATRALMAEGRPAIAGGLLEWPHNELVRFWVEAGVLGFFLVLILLGEVLRRALRHARTTRHPVERALVLAIAADMVVQCLFQNYFNSVYHATVMLMLLGMLTAGRQREAAQRLTPAT